MEYQGNILCLTHKELVPSIMPDGTYKSLKQRGKITVISRGGGKNNPALIGYESLPPAYQKAVISKYGDPYLYKANEVLAERVEYDFEAYDFYSTHKLSDGEGIPPKDIKKYITSASWLKMLAELTSDKKKIKRDYRLTMGEFWKVIKVILSNKGVDLPKNRIRLQEKISKYIELSKSDEPNDKYKFLIEDFRYGNINSKKVKDDISEALLLEMLEHPHQFDDTVILEKYNSWAVANNKPLIKSASTIGNYRRDNDWRLRLGRYGGKDNYNKYGKSISRKRPSAPLLLVNSDDNELDLFFKEVYIKDGRQHTNYYKRFVLLVVADSYNDYILGYAIGEAQTTQLVKDAYLNAMHHIKELTGGYYLPHQLNTDRWGLDKNLNNALAQFYKSLGAFTPALTGNARSKYIERSFGTEWHQQLKYFDNYAGYNITAKERVNPDAIAHNKKYFPDAEQAYEVIGEFIQRMRLNKGRQDNWLKAFQQNEISQRKQINKEQMLMLMGTPHEWSNTITNKGLNIQISGAKYRYDIPDALFLEHVGRKVQVIYDPYDMSQVLVTDNNKVRFIVEETTLMPSAIMDFEEGDRKRLNSLLDSKAKDMQRIIEERAKRQKTLSSAGVDAKSLLQAGVIDKRVKQEAQQIYIEQSNGQKPLQERDTDDDDIYNAM